MNKRTWIFPTKYPVIDPGHLSDGDADRSPKRLHYVKALIAAMIGDYMQEGVKVFDCGCGPGWLANMLSGNLKDFTYWGLEPVGRYQDAVIRDAIQSLGHDPRVTFGHLGGELEQEALANADVVYLGSIFTHLSWACFVATMLKLKPVVDRGGLIVFDCFLSDGEQLNTPGSYGLKDCYGTSFLIEKKIEELCVAMGFDLEKVMGIMAHGGHFHYNFRVTKRES